MSPQFYKAAFPSQSLPVYLAAELQVTDGANLGDGLSYSEEMVPDDIYTLDVDAEPQSLSLITGHEGRFAVAEDSGLGEPGARIHLDCVATFMPPTGDTIEVLVLVEPTSAVDAHTEEAIAGRLADHRRGRTTVVMTGSPLLVHRADRVAFLADGRLQASGTHEYLIRNHPGYRAVINRGMEDDDEH